MGKIMAGFSMSLDGFVADLNDSVDEVFKWFFSGNKDGEVTIGKEPLKVSSEGAEFIKEAGKATGVLVSARKTFDLAKAWGGKHPMGVPVVVVTHNPPKEWVGKKDSPFTFVSDGVESAIEKARQIAGDKDIAVGAPSVTRQCIDLGLLDGIHIDLVPVLLGNGVLLFENLQIKPIEMEVVAMSGGSNVTHLTYRIIK